MFGITIFHNSLGFLFHNLPLLFPFSWQCRDSRFYIRQAASNGPVLAGYLAACLWYRNYSQVPANLECQLHHCSHPSLGESSYLSPPLDNQLQLVLTPEINASLVALGANISYSCAPGTFIETTEADPSRTQVIKYRNKNHYL